jgi:hypothetical protein
MIVRTEMILLDGEDFDVDRLGAILPSQTIVGKGNTQIRIDSLADHAGGGGPDDRRNACIRRVTPVFQCARAVSSILSIQ